MRAARLPGALIRERRRPERIRAYPGAWRLAVATVCFGAFMGQLDASVVTLAYPGLRAEFGASLTGVAWVSLAYLLTLVALLIPVGRLSDAYGRKLLYLYGFVVFAAASGACALAPGLPVLIAVRIVQAAGAAMMQANSVALVATSAPTGRLRLALGVQATAQALGLALGPLIGGVLVTALGWRWVFALNVPIGLVSVVAGHYLLPCTRTRHRTPGFDWPGMLLLALTTTSALLTLSTLSRGVASPWWAAALFLLTVGAGWAFTTRQHHTPNPLINPELVRPRPVRFGLTGALCGYLILFGPLVLVPLVLTAHGASPLAAGLVLTWLPAGFALAAATGEKLLPPGWGERARCTLGAALSTSALAALCVLPFDTTALPPLLSLLGLGLGLFIPANNATVMAAIPRHRSGTGGGLINMARGTGTALGVALTALALQLPATPRWPAPSQRAVLVLLAASLLTLITARRAGTPTPPQPRGPIAGQRKTKARPAHTPAPSTVAAMSPQPRHEPTPNRPPATNGTDAQLLTEAVTRVRRALRASIRTDYPWETLPMAQVELLQALADHSPARVGDLATRQRLAFSTVSGLISQMITTGLVARATDPHDRRASAVTLTDTGRQQLTAWATAHEQRLSNALAALPEAERAALRAALPALLHIADHLEPSNT
ncbi:putative drug transporter [Streptomyces sp. NBRC 110611]|uniref:MFS transporter n=1 Tax=Streptomyces sp. NBRC 110611 TaxID=1621259 RepID=UPI0008580078|nr:MFS transporter [Streptomyces sp. NBRC 110611]GAU71142.1 putative drug transporter [Streptomyces sp. NBRC 110611]